MSEMPLWLRNLTRDMMYNEGGGPFHHYSIAFDALRPLGRYIYDEGGGGKVQFISCGGHPDGGKVVICSWHDTSGESAGDEGTMSLHFHGPKALPGNGLSRSFTVDIWMEFGFSPSTTAITGAWWSKVSDSLGREHSAERWIRRVSPSSCSASVSVLSGLELTGSCSW